MPFLMMHRLDERAPEALDTHAHSIKRDEAERLADFCHFDGCRCRGRHERRIVPRRERAWDVRPKLHFQFIASSC